MHTRTMSRLLTIAGPLLGSISIAGCEESTDPGPTLHFEALTATSATAVVAETVNPVPSVRVVDRSNQPVAGFVVTFFPVNGGSVSNRRFTTGNDGVATAGTWTLGTTAKEYTLRVQATGIESILFTAVAAAGPPALIVAQSGDRQTANTGAPLPLPLRALVTDSFGNRISGAHVTFSVLSGGGTITQGTPETDANGVASSGVWTLGASAGEQQVRAVMQDAQLVFRASACDPTCQSFQLLFIRDGNFYRTKVGGGTTLVAANVNGWSPAISRNGGRIAFVGTEGEDIFGVFLMDLDGRNVRRRLVDAYDPSWSPDGRRLAVAMGSCDGDCGVYILNADDNSGPVAIGADGGQPAWSPDGTRIAFVSVIGANEFQALHIVNVDGTGLTVVTPREGFIGHPSWSPDGTSIAFSRCIGNRCDVHVARTDGSSSRQLTNTGNAIAPDWSPDGSWIAMTLFYSDTEESAIGYVDAHEGGNPILLQSAGWQPLWIYSQVTGALRVDSARRD